jgi:formyl-CoA transferase
MGAMAALRARDITGEGQFIDTSLYESAVSLTIWEAGSYFATGEVSKPRGTAHQAVAPYQSFNTADGWITFGAITDKLWKAACDVLGLDHLTHDVRFAQANSRFTHREALVTLIEESTRQRATADIEVELSRVGVPCAPVSRPDQVFNDEHLMYRQFFWDSQHPDLGAIRQLGSPMRLSATPAVRRNAGPALGADTVDVLSEVGFDDIDIKDLLATGVVAEA